MPEVPDVKNKLTSLIKVCGLRVFLLLLLPSIIGFGSPPFSGTIFLDPDILTEADPTTFQKIEDAGRGDRTMYDRRSGWVYENAFLFNASFSDLPDVEIQVNPEFGDTNTARAQAEAYAPVIGRLPRCLRVDVFTVWIHKGNNPFGGGNNNLLIHTGQADQYVASGILEETLVHEASHTSLDADHATASGWLDAQAADGNFISTYARDNPTREDVAETFLLYFALRYGTGRISQSLIATIKDTIPNRIAYFDAQDLGLSNLDDGDSSAGSWDLATDLGDGWRSLDWFGIYYEGTSGWIYHMELGWLFRQSSATDSIWFWREGLGWLWTTNSVFPSLYREDSSSWIYWLTGNNGSLLYYDHAQGSWYTLAD